MLGLTLARRLRAAGMEPTVLESDASAGGLASSQAIGAYEWDRFYHVMLLSDRALLDLLEELGLSDRLNWGTTRSAFYTGTAFHSLSSTLDFATFPLLGPLAKARLAATILRAAYIRDWRPLEGETAESWLIRWSGRSSYERLWLPLLRAKLGENADRASAAFIWAIIARMYAARRSGLKREMFGYVDGGYATILRRLHEVLTADGVEILCGTKVRQVAGLPGCATVTLADGRELEFDHVVLTVPCRTVAAICPALTASEQARLNRVVYQGIVCPSLLLRRPLGGYYITNITDDRVPFTAVIEMTALVDRKHFGGHTLVYLPRYLTQQSPTWERSDEALVRESVEALGRMYPGVTADDVVAWQVSRARDVLALSTVNFSTEAMPATSTSMENVYLVNSAQIAAGTLNVNETVTLANQQALALQALWRRAPVLEADPA